ncbi:hypothetical protein ACEWPM_004750 [Roseovarius sp. S4756]|uniref:hypothetical protein n=1 Tax=Roseovarius maritimus TaxID=3342637 RepID=UPI003729397B
MSVTLSTGEQAEINHLQPCLLDRAQMVDAQRVLALFSSLGTLCVAARGFAS